MVVTVAFRIIGVVLAVEWLQAAAYTISVFAFFGPAAVAVSGSAEWLLLGYCLQLGLYVGFFLAAPKLATLVMRVRLRNPPLAKAIASPEMNEVPEARPVTAASTTVQLTLDPRTSLRISLLVLGACLVMWNLVNFVHGLNAASAQGWRHFDLQNTTWLRYYGRALFSVLDVAAGVALIMFVDRVTDSMLRFSTRPTAAKSDTAAAEPGSTDEKPAD